MISSYNSIFVIALLVVLITISTCALVKADGEKKILKGNWMVTFNPAVQALREHLLTDMSGGEGGTIRITARFLSTDGTQPGSFPFEIKKLIPSACSSSPHPEFWEKFGTKIFSPESVHLESNSISFSLRKVPANNASFYLPEGKTQTISCGPILKPSNPDEPPTSKGFFLEPSSFTFQIVASDPSLVFLRHPDHFPYASISYRSQQKHAKRADFDHIELYANPKLGFGGIDFYVGAIGDEYELPNPYNEQDSNQERLTENKMKDSEEDAKVKEEFKKEMARKFYCSPAPCHVRLRNRTHNFKDFKEAQTFAKRNNFDTNDWTVTETKSWLDGSSGEESQIIRGSDISIIHSGLVRVQVSPTTLYQRGFDLPPLDDVEKTRDLPKKASVYKLQLRNIDKKFLKVPLDETKPIERLMYLTLEAPYAPAQNLRITYTDESMRSFPLMKKEQGPLVVTDRCVASGFQFHVDEEIRSRVMPSFVHRCPMSLIVHGDMLPGLHPLGVKVDSLFVPGRCHGQDIGCKAALLHEAPPQANEYIMNRLKSDVKGLFTRNTFSNNEEEESTSDQQQVVFPKEIQENLVNNNNNNDEQQNKEEKDDSSSSSSFYPLASEEILGLNNQSIINPDYWIQDFDFFSKGALRIKMRPLPDFRVKQATFLTMNIHPSMIRNGRPSDATENPMGILVVPSHGVVSMDVISSSSSSSSSSLLLSIDDKDAGVKSVVTVNSETNEAIVNVVWKMDEYDEFSTELIQALQEKFTSGENLVEKNTNLVLPATWTLFAGPDSGNENTVCAKWMTLPASATSVVVSAPPTEKEIRFDIKFDVPTSNTNGASAAPDCNKIELNPPGFDKKWTESGRMPLVKSTKIKLVNPV